MTTPHTPPTQAELYEWRRLNYYPWQAGTIHHRLITEVERLRAKNISENLNGNWMDKWGACRICGGEIPHGHTNACDYYHLTKEVEELRKDKEILDWLEEHRLTHFSLTDAILIHVSKVETVRAGIRTAMEVARTAGGEFQSRNATER